jgi:hypothetical protein
MFESIRQQSITNMNGYCGDSNRFLIASLQEYADSAASLMPSVLHLYAIAKPPAGDLPLAPAHDSLAASPFPVVILFLTILLRGVDGPASSFFT